MLSNSSSSSSGHTGAITGQSKEPGSDTISQSAQVLNASVLFDQLKEKGLETISHSKRVLNTCLRFGGELRLGGRELDDLLCGAKLHDIGKLFVDLSVLHKPSPLTEQERVLLSTHPGQGAELVVRYGINEVVVETILSHHERWDGFGYPNGLAGDGIPFNARIVALADAYDTIISKRIYDPPRAVSIAVSEIENNAGTQFDPHLAEYFLRYLRVQHRHVLPRVVLPAQEKIYEKR